MIRDIHVCDHAWKNRPLCYNFRFRVIGTTLKRAIHSIQRRSQNRDSVYRSRVTRIYVRVPEKSFLAENGANLRKVSFGMFSVSVHVLTSCVQYIRHGLKHTCSVYFFVHYDHERDERTFVVFAGASARPEKS